MTRHSGHVIVACDKFKGSLTARQVIEEITRGLHEGAPDAQVRSLVVADGGDGTLEAAYSAGYEHVPVTCSGPTGEPVRSGYAVRGRTAVIEMADACGITRLPGDVLQPMTASSRGLGEIIAAALDAGLRTLVVGIGGSASTDGGAGMLSALGARLLDRDGHEVGLGGGALRDLADVDLSGLHQGLAKADVTIACDVDNPLLGDRGAAAIFGPQKGASPEQVAQLDAGLARLAELVTRRHGRDDAGVAGAGAAGGVGWAAIAVLGARLRPGIEIILELARFQDLLAGARLVVTGEGSLDRQTLLGKTPAGVSRAAGKAGIPVVAVCGRTLLEDAVARTSGFAKVYALTDLEPDPAICMREAGPLLRRLSARVASEQLSR